MYRGALYSGAIVLSSYAGRIEVGNEVEVQGREVYRIGERARLKHNSASTSDERRPSPRGQMPRQVPRSINCYHARTRSRKCRGHCSSFPTIFIHSRLMINSGKTLRRSPKKVSRRRRFEWYFCQPMMLQRPQIKSK